MSLFTRYTPKDVENLIGITTASLREQRARYVPYTFGEQNKENGRWTYNSVDMVAMACISIIEPYVPSQYDAARVAHWIKRPVARRIGLVHPDTWESECHRRPSAGEKIEPFKRYPDNSEVLDLTVDYKYALFGIGEPIITNKPAQHIAEFNDHIVHVIRLDKIAAKLPRKLVARLLADAMDDGGEDG